MSALDKNSDPVQKITIVPRMKGSLGYVLKAPEEEKYLTSKDEMLSRIVTACAGRAAEEIVFGSITDGAASDIENATNVARTMITRCGMSEKFGMVALETVENQYLDGRTALNCSNETAAEIDKEVRSIISGCYEKAKTMLSENREVLDKLAEFLLEKESITGKEFMKIYRDLKGIPEPEEAAEKTAETADIDSTMVERNTEEAHVEHDKETDESVNSEENEAQQQAESAEESDV